MSGQMELKKGGVKMKKGRVIGACTSATAAGTGSALTASTASGRLRCVPGAMDDTEKDSLKVMI